MQLRTPRKYDIMSAKENQAAAKQTFGFLHSLTNEYPAKQDEEHEVRIRELKQKI